MKWLKAIGLFLFAALLLLISFLTWVYRTEAGLQWLLEQAKPFITAALSIDNVQGRLSDQLSVGRLQYRLSENESIDVERILLNCNWLDLLVKEVYCDSVDIASTKLGLLDNEGAEPVDDISLPPLPDIHIPLPVSIEQFNLNLFQLVTIDEQGSEAEQVKVEQFQLFNAEALQSLVSFKSLHLRFQQMDWKLSGKVQMSDQWQHQLTLDLSQLDTMVQNPQQSMELPKGEESSSSALNVSLSSKGSLIKGADLKVNLSAPVNLNVTGQWRWDHGKPQAKGRIRVAEQPLTFYPALILKTMHGDWDFQWPLVAVQLKGAQQWQSLPQFNSNIELSLPNVTRGIENARVNYSATSNWSSELLNIELSKIDALNQLKLVSNGMLPVELVVKANLQGSELTSELEAQVSQDNSTVMALKAYTSSKNFTTFNTNFDFKLMNAPLVEPYQMGELVTRGNIAFQPEQLTIRAEGSGKNIRLPQLALETVSWSLAKQDTLQIKFDSTKLEAQDIVLERLTFSANGTEQNHPFKLFVKLPAKQSLNLKGVGAFDVQNASQWQVKRLVGKLDHELLQLLFNAPEVKLAPDTQSVEKLCARYQDEQGSFCVSFSNSMSKWKAETKFSTFNLKPIWQVLRPWLKQDNLELEASISGTLAASGSLSELNALAGKLEFPKAKVVTPEGQLQLSQLRVMPSDAGSSVNVEWSQFKLIPAGAALPPLQFTHGQANINRMTDKWSGKIELRNGSWSIPQVKKSSKVAVTGKLEELKISKLLLNVDANNEQLSSHFAMDYNHSDTIAGDITSRLPINENSGLSANLKINANNFEWLKIWQSRLDDVNANLNFSMGVSGSWSKPKLKGNGVLQVNKLVMEEIGLDIENSYLDLNTEDDKILLQGLLQNQKGQLAVDGQAQLLPRLKAEVKLTGTDVQVVNNASAKVIVSPDLTARYADKLFELTGDVNFNEAHLQMTKIPEQAVTVSDDTKVIGREVEVDDESPLKYRIAINLNAGERVSFKGMGIESGIRGKLSALASSQQPLKLTGQLELHQGKFEAYKQILTIEQGQLLFLGNPENPGIQFRATRTIDDMSVGVVADGTLLNPRLTLYSNPAMAEENILALLLTGRSLESLNQNEGNALANAALSLGVEGANQIAQKIGDVLGIKSLKVSSKTSADKSRVDIGAQVNERLSVGYGTSIDSDNEMQAGWIIEYRLSESLFFEATSGEEVSASISYKKKFKGGEDAKKDSKE